MPMAPVILFQTHKFLNSVNAALPASPISVRCRQSMHTKAIAPSRDTAAMFLNAVVRKAVNSADVISPEANAKSRWWIDPSPPTLPSIGTL